MSEENKGGTVHNSGQSREEDWAGSEVSLKLGFLEEIFPESGARAE